MNSKQDAITTTGLFYAVEKKHNSIVRLLLEQPTADLNNTDMCGDTALHCAVYHDGNIEAVQLLLADPRLNTVNHKNNDGETPVMLAMIFGNMDALRKLAFHSSVDLDTRDDQGRSLEEVAR